ncbi:hypothetical protein TS85_03220 [Sphingomonas hengshuiensis]|uniref:Transferrin-binding protein B C-lobe/N-lobe beta barrel domain-containing protein n=2 Tax=Sphingomonas hengshuiensis TaxID=1609977 RepID=A0A7U4J6B4_9SPHN|nr:hypothetical protein TS85_03220 [Sphingomonas hengshuiensis]
MIGIKWMGVSALAVLAACSGGGGSTSGSGGSVGTVTPTPSTPTPSPSAPTPAPSASPSYATLASLTGIQNYASGCIAFGGAVGGGAPWLQNAPFYALNSGSVSYNPTGEAFTQLGTTFGVANRISGSASATSAYTRTDSVSGVTTRFDVVQPTPGIYSRTTSLLVEGQSQGSYCVLGVPTLNTDIPNVPSVAFTRIAVRGRAFDKRSGTLVEYDLAPSSATLSVDLTTGQFTSRLTLVGSNGASRVALGTHDIIGNLMEATSGLIGGPAEAPGPAPLPGSGGVTVQSIRVDGGFFGPQGAEFAYVFSRLERIGSSPADATFTVAGTVAGAR